MHTNEIIIMALMSAVLIAGILFGLMGMARCFRGLSFVAAGSIAVFATTMFFAVVASAPEREPMRLPVFWSAILSTSVAGCCLLAGFIGLFRRCVRKPSALVMGVSMLIFPIFLLVVDNQ
ncbi:MAG: hypothetical protein WD708_10865 [Kiritimatiellia bacterium]